MMKVLSWDSGSRGPWAALASSPGRCSVHQAPQVHPSHVAVWLHCRRWSGSSASCSWLVFVVDLHGLRPLFGSWSSFQNFCTARLHPRPAGYALSDLCYFTCRGLPRDGRWPAQGVLEVGEFTFSLVTCDTPRKVAWNLGAVTFF